MTRRGFIPPKPVAPGPRPKYVPPKYVPPPKDRLDTAGGILVSVFRVIKFVAGLFG